MRKIGAFSLVGLLVACANQKTDSTLEKDRADSTKISELYANALLKNDSSGYFKHEANAIMLNPNTVTTFKKTCHRTTIMGRSA